MPNTSGAPRAPYSLDPVGFAFPALAAMGGRAPLGGPREIALACLLVGRLANEACGAAPALGPEQRQARAAAARHWLGAAALPAPVRTAMVRLADASGGEGRAAVRTALESVIAVTANQLEPAARLELGKLAQTIGE